MNNFNKIYKIRRNLGSIKSLYFPQFPKKYNGTLPIISRSRLETKFMQWCDFNQNVINWGSESFIVMYVDASRNNTIHKYFIDFNVTIRETNGKLTKYLIEIKPYSQTRPPKLTKRTNPESYKKRMMEYIRNCCKWKAASALAEKMGIKFLVITEKNLNVS